MKNANKPSNSTLKRRPRKTPKTLTFYRRHADGERPEIGEYDKLYKKLAVNHNNKDVRKQKQAFLNEYIENQISP